MKYRPKKPKRPKGRWAPRERPLEPCPRCKAGDAFALLMLPDGRRAVRCVTEHCQSTGPARWGRAAARKAWNDGCEEYAERKAAVLGRL